MYDIIIGRSEKDRKELGSKGAIYLGKHYVKMGQMTSLSNKIYLDVTTSHVVFICGKRGGGKSYTMGVIAEGFSMLEPDIKENLSIILLDTMGVYWPSKYPNYADELLLKEWGLEAKGINVTIFTPYKYYEEYKKSGIPTDVPFSIDAAEVDPDDWCSAFRQDKYSAAGVLIFNTITELKKKGKYTIAQIIEAIQNDKEAEQEVKNSVVSMFKMAEGWGVFSDKPTPLRELAKGGQISVLDVSCYATMPGGWDVKSLVVGIVGQRLFIDRMLYRKGEEQKQLNVALDYFSRAESTGKKEMPLVWLVIDEAHEFLPKEEKDANAATKPMIEIMREGRQPGISLILATQQPGKIHTDVMTQSDTVISHRITARMDVEALGLLTQSYMKEGLVRAIDDLPRVKGSAVLFDDTNERLYAMKVRPRISWHGGSAPTAIPTEKNKFSF